jgi:hypothetical protein
MGSPLSGRPLGGANKRRTLALSPGYAGHCLWLSTPIQCTYENASVFLGLVLFSVAVAQEHEPVPNGVIYGVVVTSVGEPAKGLNLKAMPLGVEIDAALPHTKTNDKGEYRFVSLPWWGKYTVYADDEKAGYSSYSTGPVGNNRPHEVEVTPASPKAEFNLSLLPKAGFIKIRLTNRGTGRTVRAMTIAIAPLEKSDARLFTDPRVFTMHCSSDHVILVLPDENLLLHVKSDGFRERDESVGEGKPINVPSGAVLTLNVEIDPAE